jgi:DNA polymerase III alpha subunit
MYIDKFGQHVYSEKDLCELYMKDSSRVLNNVLVDKKIENVLELDNFPNQIEYNPLDISIKEFDNKNQTNWFMPDEYKNLDIALYVLDKCNGDAELQRAGKELFLFQEKGMFPLLRYLKYLVDTLQHNNVIWGVGRGSSVASFVLYLLGVHRINSLYYDLDIEEFLKE